MKKFFLQSVDLFEDKISKYIEGSKKFDMANIENKYIVFTYKVKFTNEKMILQKEFFDEIYGVIE
jgi:hypothetical protein